MSRCDAIFPGYQAPVIRVADDGERELVLMTWGFILLQAGKAPRRVTNVRDDTILSSPFWRPSFRERRCLVPVSSYCDPKGEKPATWFWFALSGAEERPAFAFPRHLAPRIPARRKETAQSLRRTYFRF